MIQNRVLLISSKGSCPNKHAVEINMQEKLVWVWGEPVEEERWVTNAGVQ
jgi:hypothetical protein